MTVFAEILVPDTFHIGFKLLQLGDISHTTLGISFIEFFESFIQTLQAGCRTGKEGFQKSRLQQISGPLSCLIFSGFIHVQFHPIQFIKSSFFSRRGRCFFYGNFSFQKGTGHLVLHVFFEAADEKALNIFCSIFLGVGNSRRIQHVHKGCKTAGSSIMGRSGEQNQGVGPPGKEFRQLGTLGLVLPICHVLCFIDDNNVPIGIFQMYPVFHISFQCINRNNHFIIIEKRIVIGRKAGTNAGNTAGVQPHQGNRKTIPHFLLELGHHTFYRNHKDTFPLAPGNEFRHQNTGFQCLTEAYTVRNKDTLPQAAQCHFCRFKLIRHGIHHCLVANMDGLISNHFLTQLAFNIESGFPVVPAVINNKVDILRIHRFDMIQVA